MRRHLPLAHGGLGVPERHAGDDHRVVQLHGRGHQGPLRLRRHDPRGPDQRRGGHLVLQVELHVEGPLQLLLRIPPRNAVQRRADERAERGQARRAEAADGGYAERHPRRRLEDDLSQVGRDGITETVGHRAHLAAADAVDRLVVVLAGVAVLQRRDLVEDQPHRIDVGALVAVFAAHRFGREEARRAGDDARRLPRLRVELRVVDAPGEAPVHEVRLVVLADHDVLGLEVAVHDVAIVGLSKTLNYLKERYSQ